MFFFGCKSHCRLFFYAALGILQVEAKVHASRWTRAGVNFLRSTPAVCSRQPGRCLDRKGQGRSRTSTRSSLQDAVSSQPASLNAARTISTQSSCALVRVRVYVLRTLSRGAWCYACTNPCAAYTRTGATGTAGCTEYECFCRRRMQRASSPPACQENGVGECPTLCPSDCC